MLNSNKYQPLPCFIITAYDQVDLVNDNIFRIRGLYPVELSQCPVIVVSTFEEDLFSTLLKRFDNTYFIHFKNAPGNPNSNFESLINPKGNYTDWRAEFLPPRILMSLQKGLKFAHQLNCTSALHLHSDTYWQPGKIKYFQNELKEIKNLLFIGDLSYQNEKSAFLNRELPFGIHFQPEGLHINIKEAINCGFADFSYIWNNESLFKTHNYGSIEAIIGQFAHFKLTGLNILNNFDHIKKVFHQRVKIRVVRDYHGSFSYGLVNLDINSSPPSILKRFFLFATNKLLRMYLIFKNL